MCLHKDFDDATNNRAWPLSLPKICDKAVRDKVIQIQNKIIYEIRKMVNLAGRIHEG